MIQANELILLLFGMGGLIFIRLNNVRLKNLPEMAFLLYGFYSLLAAWAFTVAEGFVWPGTLNVLEHLAYLASALLILVWCVQFVYKGGKR
ncbi:MAG: hypothetical protein JSV89_02910 [Spirochaetaceae bacterium]|nr:MAG: hypothetical protein JSV89_02910 [Spirochaetaceae bacterium]